MDDQSYAHTPYSILLTKVFQQHVAENGKRPTIKEMRTKLAELRRDDETNLEEAYNRANMVLKNSNELNYQLREIFENPKLDDLTKTTPIFWIYTKALKNFYEKHFVIPLSGALPDMESDTSSYIELQQLYRKKHEEDKTEIKDSVLSLLEELGRSKEEFNQQYLDTFVKNCKFMEVHHGSTKKFDGKLYIENQWDPKKINGINVYLAFLAISEFYKAKGRFPTSSDRSELRSTTISMLCKYPEVNFPEGLEKILDELCRAQGNELHNIGSLMGGIAAQEVIKLLTNQYITVDNTMSFDGIKSYVSSWKL
ncbi:unnamed protein product [Ambrosiozyma monospora]|uniref:Unnamed protein product n=1 Tax=Ambrosiozyma monospora TaxID=43982 RepID=A0ACB5TD53_AMBMO|nr:unnamed protein product [Ambrosiozyma monospora]